MTIMLLPANPAQRFNLPVWASRVRPALTITARECPEELLWADDHPVVYAIATEKRSGVYGVGACHYIGWAQRGNDPRQVWARVTTFYRDVHDTWTGRGMLFGWRARFTLAHYHDRGFSSALFRTEDAAGHPGDLLTLDWTPDTLETVARRFAEWATPYRHPVAVVAVRRGAEIARWDWAALRGGGV